MSAYTPSMSRSDAPSVGQPPAPGVSQRYGQRAATAIARFAQPFLYPSRPPSAQGQRDHALHIRDGTRPPNSNAHAFGSRDTASLHTSQPDVSATEKPIVAIDVSPDKAHVVLAGRDILRTASVGFDGALTENINIIKHINVKHREQLAVVDVRWSHHHNSLIATAAGNSLIVIYDLNRPFFEFTTLYEHVRQVHKLAFHPHGGPLFLSGSHDGGIKLWDLRDVRDARRSQATFQGANQGTRDVKWSTMDAVEFAAGTDSGVVQRWDMRKPKAPTLQLNAHESTCHSIDYHPFSKYLVSAGIDKKVKVWDTTRNDRRQNPCTQIQAPQSVLNVSWRPGHENIRNEDQSEVKSRMNSQIVTSYDAKDLRVHVWDFARPSIPCREINFLEGPVSALTWRSKDLLWIAGGSSNQGIFCQADIGQAIRPADRMNLNVLAVSPTSDMAFFSEHRKVSSFAFSCTHEDLIRRTSSDVRNEENLGRSLSATDSSFEEFGFAAPTTGQRKRRATGFVPNTNDSRNEDFGLIGEHHDAHIDYSASTLGPTFETTQCGEYGMIHGIFDMESFQNLADNYVSPLLICKRSNLSKAAADVESVFLKNSSSASRIGDNGLAHTWRVLAWAVRKELEDLDQTVRTKEFQPTLMPKQSGHTNSTKARPVTNEDSTLYLDSNETVKMALRADNGGSAISSSISTPKTRPQDETPPANLTQSSPAHQYKDVSIMSTDYWKKRRRQSFDHERTPATIENLTDTSQRDKSGDLLSKTTERSMLEFVNMEEHLAARRAAMSTYRLTLRPLLKLDDAPRLLVKAGEPESPAASIFINHAKVVEQDSSDGFDMLSESEDSHKQNFAAESFEEALEPTADAKGFARVPGGRSRIVQSSFHTNSPTLLGGNDRCYLRELDGSNFRQKIQSPMINLCDIDTVRPRLHEISGKKTRELSDRFPDNMSEEDLTYAHMSALVFGCERRPWQASFFLPALLTHYLDYMSSLQLPVFLIAYLHRYYPDLFSSLSHRVEEAHLTRRSNGTSADVHSYFAAVFLSYHGQLVSLRRHIAAADLRKSSGHIVPELKNRANPGNVKKYWCRGCSKLSKGSKTGFCTRCKKRWGGCSVCGDLRFPQDNEPHGIENGFIASQQIFKKAKQLHPIARRRWLYCQTCGHGGHASCLISWLAHPESSGCCCMPGCRHACGPGDRREELRAALARRKAEMNQLRRGNGILRDDKIVPESRAVKAARPDTLEVEIGELGNNNAVEIIDASKNGGIVAESVTGPSFIGVGVVGGRGRWRTNHRADKSIMGSGGISDGLTGSKDSEIDERRQHHRQPESSDNIDSRSDPLHLRFDNSFTDALHRDKRDDPDEGGKELELEYQEGTLSLP